MQPSEELEPNCGFRVGCSDTAPPTPFPRLWPALIRLGPGRGCNVPGANAARGLDLAVAWPNPFATMKILPSNVVATFLALAVSAGVTSAFASSLDQASSAQPQCGGDDKKESKGGDKKDDKSSDTKPKPTPQG